jgi:tetratricopeptide (TPR) repeat protein
LVGDYPFIGAGLGGYMMLYSTYALMIHVGFEVHSHNMYLNVAVEQGFLALLILVWMWLLFAWAVVRAMGRARPRPGTWALYAAALSLVVILIHGLVDDVLYGSRAVLLLFVPLAFAVPLWPDRRATAERFKSLTLPLGIILLLIAALLGRNWLLSRGFSNLGAVHQSRAELSIYSWPEWPIQDEVRRQVNLSQPVAEFGRALAFDPGNATANRRLGMIELALGEYEAAQRHLEAAYAAEPGSVATRQLYGEALIVNGRVDEGRALWTEVSNEQGQLGMRAWWYEYIGETERAEWVKEAAEGR